MKCNDATKVLALAAAAACAAAATAQIRTEARSQQPDPARIAQTLVNQCARIGYDNLVLISGGARDLDLLEDIAVQVRQMGAHPLVTLESEDLDLRFYTDVPEKFDTQKPKFAMKLVDMIDAHFSIDHREHPDLFANVPPQRMMERSKAFAQIEKRMLERAIQQVHLGNGLYPTRTLARQFEIPMNELSRIFWNAVTVDYARIEKTGQQLRNQLTSGNELKITAPNGTNLTVKITKRPIFVSDGVISTKDREPDNPNCQIWLPAGEVYFTPVPGTAEGTFIADHFFFEGKPIERLQLQFQNGRLTSMTADKGDLTPLKQRYEAAPSGRDLFAVIDIGINPNLKIPKDSRMVTWMAAGTISVVVGSDTWAGGDNDVPFWLPAHLTTGTLTIDGKPIIENGRLAFAEPE